MDTLNQMEVQDIRHTCSCCNSLCTKIKYYKSITNNENALQIMDKICTTCDNLKQELISKL